MSCTRFSLACLLFIAYGATAEAQTSVTSTTATTIVDIAPSITSNPTYNAAVNQFGGTVLVAQPATSNAIVGAAVQDGSNHASFPTGVTAYGYLNNAGNTVFGLFGRADCYTAGDCTNELDSFNYAGTTYNSFPPTQGFGTTQILPIGLTFGSYGNYPSYAALIGQSPALAPGTQGYVVFEYLGAGISSYGIVVDATTTADSPAGLIVNTTGAAGHIPITMQTKNTPVAGRPMLETLNNGGGPTFSLFQDGSVQLYAHVYADLPTCNAAAQGTVYYITDSSTATFNAVVTGGGSSVGLALCNGIGWVFH